MKKVGIISDTHGFWDERYERYMGELDEIWHAGDIGSAELAERFEAMKPHFRAVCGNCDGGDLRLTYPETLRFKCEKMSVLMKHIGGYPGKYDPSIRQNIMDNPPRLFISGHSHILRVEYDSQLGLLHINPGAAGLQGWQLERTLVRITVNEDCVEDCEVVKLGKS